MWLLKCSSFRFDDFYLLLSQWFFINLWPRYFRFLFNFIHEEVKMMHAEVNQHAMNACGPPSSSSQIIHFVKIILDVLRCAQYVLLHLRPFPFLVLSTQQRKTLSKWNNDLSKQNYHFMNSNKEKDSFYRYNQKCLIQKYCCATILWCYPVKPTIFQPKIIIFNMNLPDDFASAPDSIFKWSFHFEMDEI